VEDEPEESVAETYESTDKTTPLESDEAASTNEPATEMSMPFEAPSSSATLLSGVDLPLRTAASTQLETAEIKAEEETEAHLSQKLSAIFTAPSIDSAVFDQRSTYSSFDNFCAPRATEPPVQPPVQAPPIITAAPFAVCCNNCEKTVSDVHYHCQTCDDGDFDLCQHCVDAAVSCYDDNHWLIKRTMIDGQLIASSTEKIEPKSQMKKQVEDLFNKAASVLPSIETSERQEAEALKAARLDKVPAFSPPIRHPRSHPPLPSTHLLPTTSRLWAAPSPGGLA
jgi:next-to-BRCA1 protein 1